MQVAIALYKGPPAELYRKVGHYGIRLWTWSKWSHAELVIDGWCYSSSVMDGGVRRKKIDLEDGHWDVIEIHLTDDQLTKALLWFAAHDGDGYDYHNIVRWVAPFIPQHPLQYVCFETIGEMLDMAGAYRLDADDLYAWAMKHQPPMVDQDEQFELQQWH